MQKNQDLAEKQDIIHEQILDPKKHTLIRLDGHKFSKMVKIEKLELPFDEKFNKAMIATAEDGLQEYNFYLAYVGSDEITYYIPPVKNELTQLQFGGRYHKLISLLAGFISVKFNKHFGTQDYYFDCRMWQVDSLQQVHQNFKDRRSSVIRNARMMLAQKYYSTKQLHNIKSKEAVAKLLEEKKIDFYETVSEYNRVGLFIFKTQVTEEKQIKGVLTEIKRKKLTTSTDVKYLEELLKNQ